MEIKNLKAELQNYIEDNFQKSRADYQPRLFFAAAPLALSKINFNEMYENEKGETFSNMLLRLIEESGEKNSAIYNRANIDRRHFSKIANNENYRTTRETALAFAIALRLNFEQTQELLSTAGYTLTNTNLGDVIVTFFIKRQIYDVFLINDYLYEYKQTLLGG